MDGKRLAWVGLAGALALVGIAALLQAGPPPDEDPRRTTEQAPGAARDRSPPRSRPITGDVPDEAPPETPLAVVTGEIRLPDGPDAEWVGVEGCGAAVPADEAGAFALPVGEACEVRVLVRNGGAESRGPKRWVGPETASIALEAPEVPPWEPPVPPHWHEGGNEGLSEQQRRDERLAYLRQVLAAGTLSPERESMTREVVERLERQTFE